MPRRARRPEDCPDRVPLEVGDTIDGRLDQRLAKGRELDELDGTPATGRRCMWARIPEVLDGVDAAALAVLGDFVPMGVGQALGIRGGGNSLDNTLRIVRLVPTDWVLLDIRVHAVEPRVRPRARAHVRRGRHAARHGQPELHRALLARRPGSLERSADSDGSAST